MAIMQDGAGNSYTETNSLPVKSAYKDNGLIGSFTGIAAGATQYTNYVTDLQWVKNYLLFISSDVSYDLLVQRKNTLNISDIANAIVSGQTSTTGQYRTHLAYASTGTPSVNGILGYSARFGVKNVGAVPSGAVNLYLQCFA